MEKIHSEFTSSFETDFTDIYEACLKSINTGQADGIIIIVVKDDFVTTKPMKHPDKTLNCWACTAKETAEEFHDMINEGEHDKQRH